MTEIVLGWLILLMVIGIVGTIVSTMRMRARREIVSGRSDTPDSEVITCRIHGPVQWEEHLVCSRCMQYIATLDELYEPGSREILRPGAAYCRHCGCRFLPHDKDRKHRSFSARPVCPECARQGVPG